MRRFGVCVLAAVAVLAISGCSQEADAPAPAAEAPLAEPVPAPEAAPADPALAPEAPPADPAVPPPAQEPDLLPDGE
jgi:2-oxoglutarate dehydrogenase E2 component (dihydrolipoamide succinyltransferase)